MAIPLLRMISAMSLWSSFATFSCLVDSPSMFLCFVSVCRLLQAYAGGLFQYDDEIVLLAFLGEDVFAVEHGFLSYHGIYVGYLFLVYAHA